MDVTTSETAERLAHAAILGQLAEGVIVTDANGRITYVNAAAETIHGVARLDVEPENYSETYRLFTEAGLPYPPLDLPLARAVRGLIVRDERWRILRPDGTTVLAIGSARPLLGIGGRQIGAVLTLRDDTARDAAERALRRLNATLAERVAERTREAEAAREAAEAASRAKTEFLATMSHEIRTPLSGILGYADLLLETADPLTVRRAGARIRSAGAALLTIVNDVLDFAKVEAGRVDLVAAPFDPARLGDDVAEIVRCIAEKKGLALHLQLDPTIGEVVGDADRLRQVMLNLLNNAVKFTPAGSVTLGVRRLNGEGGVVRLRITVEDTGIGIAAADQDRLFERFSQVDGSMQREHGGTGLGLAISKRLVELMGGAIGCDSEPGRGSMFWFEVSLPLAGPAEPPATVPGPVATVGRRLLVVEDVAVNRDLARAILERAGHHVDVAVGGAEAVAAVQAEAYDLVLMDVQMPVTDGLAATRLIRALDHPASGVPIVAMSANVLPHQVALCREAGMQDHVGKPYKRDTLLAAVARWTAATDAPPDDAAFDRGTLDALLAPIDPAAARRLLTAFAHELAVRFGSDSRPIDAATLRGDAHAVVPAAAMLGFSRFAALCREAEAAVPDEVAPVSARLRSAGRDVLAIVQGLAAAAETAA